MNQVNVRIRRSALSGAAALLFARTAHAQARACGPAPVDSVARWAAPLDRPISVRTPVVSLRDALDRVAAVAGIRLSYSSDLVPLDRAACAEASSAPVGQVLAGLLDGTNLTPVSVGSDQIVLTPRQSAQAPGPASPEVVPPLGVLDRVVITGTAVGAPEREETVAVSVVDGRQLAREHASSLSAAFDGWVPGIWAWSQSPASVMSSYASIRGASSFGLSYPKVYIDGIEAANPLLIGQFAPDAIDRVEVIRGPQGSALYGADAISGVVNILSRYEGTGAEGQHASVRSNAGLMQSDFSHSVLAQNHALSLAAGSATRSADLHVAGGSVGAFIPNGYSRNFIASGTARSVGERTTFSATARYFTQEAGSAGSPLLTPLSTTLADTSSRSFSSGTPPQSIREYTIGTNATYVADDRWTHTGTIGIDGYRLSNAQTNLAPVMSPTDSALLRARGGADRVTIRGSSVVKLAAGEGATADLTFSAEQGIFHSTTLADHPPSLAERGTFASLDGRALTEWESSTGLTTQARASFHNALFATAGVRLERDSRLPIAEVATLPMLGAAAVRDYGPLTVKLRAAYGEGIRPPSTFARSGLWPAPYVSSQATLGPEKQTGTEAGIDLLVRRAFSFRATRFDQMASGLIQQVALLADSNPASRRMRYELENVGEIANRGWELESSANVSRLTVTGTLSLVSSRVERVAAGYNGDLRAGDRMLQVPARTGSVNLSWLGKGWYASLGGSRALDWINYDELGLARAYSSDARSARDVLGQQLRQYWRQYDGGLRVHASLSRDLRDTFTFEVSGDNLLNYQFGEPDNVTVVPGRTMMTGLRVRF